MTIYHFILPDHVPALKNNRDPVVDRNGKFKGTRPRKVVEDWVNQTKTKITRQLPSGFEVITPPTEVGVLALIGVYSASYPKTLPQSDLDNAWTTIQESLFTANTLIGPLVKDDRQIADFRPVRRIIKDRELLMTEIWAWPFTSWEEHLDIQASVNAEVNAKLKRIYEG